MGYNEEPVEPTPDPEPEPENPMKPFIADSSINGAGYQFWLNGL